MRTSLLITGITETQENLAELKGAIPDTVEANIQTDMYPMWAAVTAYPTRPRPSSYVRTYAYGMAVTINVHRAGDMIIGEIDQPETPGVFLHGDTDGRMPAWMHLGIWRPLKEIIDFFAPVVTSRIERRIEALIERIMER